MKVDAFHNLPLSPQNKTDEQIIKKHPNLQEPQSELAISTAWSQPVYSSMHGSNPVQGTSNKNGNVDQKKKKAPNFASL